MAKAKSSNVTAVVLCHWAGEVVDIATDHFKDFTSSHGGKFGLRDLQGDPGAGPTLVSWTTLQKFDAYDQLAALLDDIPWARPESVVMIVQPPDSEAKTFRPRARN